MDKIRKNALKGRNLLVTGGAGTGKSYAAKQLAMDLQDPVTGRVVALTATTGTAAYIIGGVTLHSFAAFKPSYDDWTAEEIYATISCNLDVHKRYNETDTLIVDEVSMLHAKLFIKLNDVFKLMRESDEPFGGMQVVFFADFFQLPPVVRGNVPRNEPLYMFETDEFNEIIDNIHVLTTIHRQTDSADINVLNKIRVGIIDKDVRSKISECIDRELSTELDIEPTRLFSKNAKVAKFNKERLDQLTTAEYNFYAIDTVTVYKNLEGNKELTDVDRYFAYKKRNDQLTAMFKDITMDEIISLKVGAHVVLLKNINVSAGLVNGSIGVVTAVVDDGKVPIVDFVCGCKNVRIEPFSNELEVRDTGKITRKQIPLKLAFALSIHKSQGMTLDYVETSLTASEIFTYGQVYVALSRIRNLDSLRLTGFSRNVQFADPRVLRFYKSILPNDPLLNAKK